MNDKWVHTSKFLSYVLRHAPESIGMTLDSEGWASISELIALANQRGRKLNLQDIETVVATNDKKRFALSADGTCIRAVQGHSTRSVAMTLEEKVPPPVLYHGTATRFVLSIRKRGLLHGARQHVHLSDNTQTAFSVGLRHGMPVVLSIAAQEFHARGGKFYLSENHVWLTEHVPPAFIGNPAKTHNP
jgi:putative RNA 2'-phosphotransferase